MSFNSFFFFFFASTTDARRFATMGTVVAFNQVFSPSLSFPRASVEQQENRRLLETSHWFLLQPTLAARERDSIYHSLIHSERRQ